MLLACMICLTGGKNSCRTDEQLLYSRSIGVIANIILCSDTTSQIMSFSRECFLRHYGGQLKTVVKQEAGKKVDFKR